MFNNEFLILLSIKRSYVVEFSTTERIIAVSLAVKDISYSRMESTRFITVIHALSYAVFLSILSLASIGL